MLAPRSCHDRHRVTAAETGQRVFYARDLNILRQQKTCISAIPALTKGFTLINDIERAEISSFAGVPSSDCNGWRLWDDADAENCGYKGDFPITLSIPDVKVRAVDLNGDYVEHGVVSGVALAVQEKENFENTLTYDEMVAQTTGSEGGENLEKEPTSPLTELSGSAAAKSEENAANQVLRGSPEQTERFRSATNKVTGR